MGEYKKIAKYYDRASAWALNPVREKIAAAAKSCGAASVLDMGCGTGLQLEYLRRQGLRVCGADSSPDMLAIARQRLCGGPGVQVAGTDASGTDASGADGCPLVLGDVTGLPFDGDSFDLAVISLVLHESDSDPDAILAEALRVAPRVWILEWAMAERNLDYPIQGVAHLVEVAAGMRHLKAFKRFMGRGGVEGLVSRHDAEIKNSEKPVLKVQERQRALLGTLALIKTIRA